MVKCNGCGRTDQRQHTGPAHLSSWTIHPYVRHDIAVWNRWARNLNRAERNWRALEPMLPALKRRMKDAEISDEVIDAQQVEKGSAGGLTNAIRCRQNCLHLVIGGHTKLT